MSAIKAGLQPCFQEPQMHQYTNTVKTTRGEDLCLELAERLSGFLKTSELPLPVMDFGSYRC